MNDKIFNVVNFWDGKWKKINVSNRSKIYRMVFCLNMRNIFWYGGIVRIEMIIVYIGIN